MGLFATGSRLLSTGQKQWAPTLTAHNPSPPITLDHVSAAVPGSVSISAQAGTGAIIAPAAKGKASVSASANAGTGAIVTPTAKGKASASVSALVGAGASLSITARGKASVSVSARSGTGASLTPTARGKASRSVSPQAGTGAIVPVSATVTLPAVPGYVALTAQSGAVSRGSPAVGGKGAASVSAQVAAGAIVTPTVSGRAIATLSAVSTGGTGGPSGLTGATFLRVQRGAATAGVVSSRGKARVVLSKRGGTLQARSLSAPAVHRTVYTFVGGKLVKVSL